MRVNFQVNIFKRRATYARRNNNVTDYARIVHRGYVYKTRVIFLVNLHNITTRVHYIIIAMRLPYIRARAQNPRQIRFDEIQELKSYYRITLRAECHRHVFLYTRTHIYYYMLERRTC